MPKTTSQIRRSARRYFRWCLVDGRLDESRVREVAKQILQSKRRGYLALIGEFKRLVKLERATYSVRVESATPLQNDMQARVRKNLETAYGTGLTAEFAQNPELIGGIRVRVANDVYDNSVKSKLAALARSFGILDGKRLVR